MTTWQTISDRDRGDDPRYSDVQAGDRIVIPGFSVDFSDDSPLVRIERRASNACTCLPIATSQETEPDEFCPKHGRWTERPNVPTREQVAESVQGARDALAGAVRSEWVRDLHMSVQSVSHGSVLDALVQLDALLAVIWKGTDR